MNNNPPIENFVSSDWIQLLKDGFNFLISKELQHNVLAVKIIFLFVSFLFLIAIIYLLKKTNYHHLRYLENVDILAEFKDFGSGKRLKKWQSIKENLKKEDPVYWKIGVLEGEKFFDDMLQEMGFGSGTIDDRIARITENDCPNIKDVIQIHQICRDIVQDPDYRLNFDTAQHIFDVLEKALYHLNIF